MALTAPPPRPRQGGPPNRIEQAPFDRQQGSFRPPPRTQVPPRPIFSQPSHNPHWMNAPPRMQVPYAGSDPTLPSFGMTHMRRALDAIDHGYPGDSGRMHPGVPPVPVYGRPDAYPTHDFQSYSPYPPSQSHPMPRFQQYHSNMDHMITALSIEQSLQTQYPHPQYYPPTFAHPAQSYGPSFVQPNGPSFMRAPYAQYYANPGTAGAQGGFPAPNSRQGDQQWGT
jgi:hypothetical protein